MTEAKGTEVLARVVIAEDEAIIRLDLKEILTSAGYEVVGESGRGDEAVELVAEHLPDLAILDIKMPGMDGLRAAREITSQYQVAVVLMTAFSQRDLDRGGAGRRGGGLSGQALPGPRAVARGGRRAVAGPAGVGPGGRGARRP